MKTAHLLLYAAAISFSSAFFGGAMSLKLLRHQRSDVLKVREIEIEDSQGQRRARLGVEHNGGVSLRFFSPHQEALLSVGLQGGGNYGSRNSAPVLQINNTNGRQAIIMSTNERGNGTLAFDSDMRSYVLRLGNFPVDEDYRSLEGAPYQWGLGVHSEHGETGVGIVDGDKSSEMYISPTKARRH